MALENESNTIVTAATGGDHLNTYQTKSPKGIPQANRGLKVIHYNFKMSHQNCTMSIRI